MATAELIQVFGYGQTLRLLPTYFVIVKKAELKISVQHFVQIFYCFLMTASQKWGHWVKGYKDLHGS